MDTYSLLREFADSWVLLAMFAFFVGVGIWAFWPSLAQDREDASLIPFRNDAPETCARDCDNCACSTLSQKLKEV
jgi:cytochrome c oxidase cbb3-type subunit 4